MQKITHPYAITLALVSFLSYAMPVWAKPDATFSNIPASLQVHFAQPPLPDNGTPTGRPRGAAGRGNCTLNPPLTALVPVIEKNLGKVQGKVAYVWGKTVAEYPTFWFYVPYSHTSLRSVEFVLQDAEDNDVYRTHVSLPRMPGVVSLRLPSTSTPLKIGKMYHWFFKIKANCDSPKLTDVKDYVDGWVQRVMLSPTLKSQLEAATPQQRIALYATNGIWYEALTTLATLRLVNLEDASLRADWTSLLQSANLVYIASKPIVSTALLCKK